MMRKQKPISLPELLKKTQLEFNKFIRNRDKDKPCISSGGRVEQAGHFYSAGQFTALRFNEDNVHGQCLSDNYYKHGNLIPYRKELLKRIGEDRLNILEAAATRHRVRKWSRTELEIILKIYKEKNETQDV
jgi:hypothetical protein